MAWAALPILLLVVPHGTTASVTAQRGATLVAGTFRRVEAGYGGAARISRRGTALRLRIALSFKRRPTCDLDGVLLASPEGYTVRSGDGPVLILRPAGNGFDLAYVDPAHRPWQVDYCLLGTGIDGHYRRVRPGGPGR
ncbi:hypothetical protein SAMN06297144_0177 [Sphingomonas guangdongensis]|uniref:Uncharacterized protein n=1 Tax=Sphingomonas guangdongensis TaxID=1141890 RepID=A0A285QA25_9SPHN|nr:hypothetical protein [Sphingomonas guangdongensis]SOB78713.1 hypothetical protein SAMN06297144_0177 [Sphingomonas guangdongensis]